MILRCKAHEVARCLPPTAIPGCYSNMISQSVQHGDDQIWAEPYLAGWLAGQCACLPVPFFFNLMLIVKQKAT